MAVRHTVTGMKTDLATQGVQKVNSAAPQIIDFEVNH